MVLPALVKMLCLFASRNTLGAARAGVTKVAVKRKKAGGCLDHTAYKIKIA
jgi:hypothetical protein